MVHNIQTLLDPIKNFGKVTVSTGYNNIDTVIVLNSGDGAKLPYPATEGPFNLVWYNWTEYRDPADDPNREIVRVTAREGDVLTVLRAQEETIANAKNLSGMTYKMVLTMTAKIVSDMIGTALPTGSIIPYGGSAAPSGFLLCDGSAVSITTYATLFSIIGTTYGIGDGSTTFNVPDYRGRTILGAGQGSGLTNRNLGNIGGTETHTLNINEIPIHSHTFQRGTGGNYCDWGNSTFATGPSNCSPGTTGTGGGGLSHNNMQPFGVANYIIKT